ncbi:hypothetical protein [Neptunicella sp.]|uniref:hypothetical protein n=1 Tax=Neptunicella sp. TaxID=2125986 RepID=UPI003F68DA50
MNEDDLEIHTCASECDPQIGAHVGVEIRHKPTQITVRETKLPTQFANKTEAMKKLELELLALIQRGF